VKELFFTAAPIDAKKALECAVSSINHLAPSAQDAHTMQVARKMTRKRQPAFKGERWRAPPLGGFG
jgi:hypothetical protein